MKQSAFILLFLFCVAKTNAQSDSATKIHESPWGTTEGWGITGGFSYHKTPVFEFGIAHFIEHNNGCAFGYGHYTRAIIAAYNPENNIGSLHASAWSNSGLLLSFGIDAGYYTNFCCRQAGSIMPMIGLGIYGCFVSYGYNLLIPVNQFNEIEGSTFNVRVLIKIRSNKSSLYAF